MRKRTLILLSAMLLLALGAAAQQRFEVTGKVVDAAGLPITGAAVMEDGTSHGTSTDPNGAFTLAVPADAVLEISFIGYVTRLIPAADISTMPIILEEDGQLLDEVVVIGYGTVRKTDLTGSVVAVKADELNRGAVTSTQEMLMGKVPGVYVLPGDGGPGSGSTLRIRGGSSLNASNDPLIVIDGVSVSNDAAPGMSNPLSSINPNDIESFTVLKDASATAIYGSRASNGVIIITTKKGSGLCPQVSYNSSYSLSVNSGRVDVMSPGDYRDYVTALYPDGTADGTTVRSLMGTASTDWQKEIFRPAFATDQNISVFGNVREKMPYRVSGGYTSQDGTLETSNYQRATLDVSLQPMFFDDHLKVNINAKESYTWNKFVSDASGVVRSAAFFDPTQETHFRAADGAIDPSRANGYWNWFGPDGQPNRLSSINPLSMLYDHYQNSEVNRLTGNVQLDYKVHFLPELRLNLNLGTDRAWSYERSGDNVGSYQAARDGDAPGIGRNTLDERMRSNDLLEFYAAYAGQIGRHRFDVMGGYSWQYFFIKNNQIVEFNDGRLFNDPPAFKYENQLLSFFGRANYSFDSRLLLTVSLRADASSRFAKENRWGYFPSAALAWNLKNEKWLANNPHITDLKLRLGYGQTGQQDIGGAYYPYLSIYDLTTDPGNTYMIDGQYVSTLKPRAYDPKIKWETTTTYNIGLDWGILQGRLFGSIDAYLRDTKDLINTVGIPRGSNFSNVVTTNIGSMRNHGVELSLGARIVERADLQWSASLNATWQTTEITQLTMIDDPNYYVSFGRVGQMIDIQRHMVGHAPGTFYTYQQVWGPDGKPIQNTFVDRMGDGQITESDRYMTDKKPAPDIYFGLGTKLTYKNWDFGLNGHGSFGNWLFNEFYAGNATPVGDYLTQGFLVNVANTVKRSGFTRANGPGQRASDMFLENASFFRLDDVTVGHTFHNLSRYSDTNLRVAFTAQNLFVITSYSGLDPETGTIDNNRQVGIDNNVWPRPRIFSIRLALNF